MSYWRQIWRPDAYHGSPRQHNFFEGWYFKLVDAPGQTALAVIPGVFLGRDRASSYCFVQTLDGQTGHTTFHRYPLEQFSASARTLDVCAGPNRFRRDAIELDIDTPERHLRGRLTFADLAPWPVSPLSPGIMGWYAFVPFMECYHGVVSLDHAISGRLEVDGRPVDFDGGRGYIEKDWGQAFPRAWVWMQTNHFEQPGISLTASVATIPWLGTAFPGFIVGLWHGGRLYRWATYTGARITRLSITDTRVEWHMVGRALGGRTPYRLEITAERSEGGLLHAPFRTDMLQRVAESLTARVAVRLLAGESSGGRLIYAGTGLHAGLEINGAVEEITY